MGIDVTIIIKEKESISLRRCRGGGMRKIGGGHKGGRGSRDKGEREEGYNILIKIKNYYKNSQTSTYEKCFEYGPESTSFSKKK